MRIAVLHGQTHKGSTRHICDRFIEQIADENDVVENFTFVDNHTCRGCFACIMHGEDKCPYYDENKDIISSLLAADLIVMESPNYCMGMSGQLKVFLDHLAYLWMPHRPHKEMFSKVGLCISTSAGTGHAVVTKEMKRNMFYWGMPSVYRFHKALGAAKWTDVKNPDKLYSQIDKLAAKIKKKIGHTKTKLPTKFIWSMMRMMHRGTSWSPTDHAHWESQGWLEKERPWKERG